MNYVLLNGSEDEDEYQPFKVKDKILNFENIHQLSAGSQHVVYTAYENPKEQENGQKKEKRTPNIFLDSKVHDLKALSSYKLSKKRR